MSFEWAFTVVMKHEGGFVNDAADPGGATNYGVSLRFLRKEGIDIDGDGDINEDDIHALTPQIARDIYRDKFWNPCRCNAIRSELIATKIFDMAVNMGRKQAYRIAQRAVNQLDYDPKLTVDGLVGPATLNAINSLELTDYELLEVMREEQAEFYTELIRRKPQLAKFRLGWLRRAIA